MYIHIIYELIVNIFNLGRNVHEQILYPYE
jgi:hypothetical protein